MLFVVGRALLVAVCHCWFCVNCCVLPVGRVSCVVVFVACCVL